jgi:hypothetical protein
MFNAIAVMSKQDILAIYGVVSNELKAQIEQSYPHLFEPEQFDFTEWEYEFNFSSNLPFVVGKGLVSKEDRFKSLIVKTEYKVEMETTYSGLQVIRFIKK